MKYLLVDYGSTSVKYAAFDGLDKSPEIKCFPFPNAIIESDTRYEVELKAIHSITENIFKWGTQQGCEKAIISVQMHGYILKTENGYSNYISWRDKRADITDQRLKGIDWYERGTAIKKNLPFASLLQNELTPKACELFTLGSWLAFILTGNNKTHITDAAASGFYNADSAVPDCSLYKGLKLPNACVDLESVGFYGNMEIYSPAGDHQISYLGSSAEENAYLLNVGTAAQISTVGTAHRAFADCEARPYFKSGKRLFTVSGLVGGKELVNGCSEQELIESYSAAFKKLPERSKVLIGGGGALHNRELFSEAMERIGIEYSFIEDNITFEGLMKMTEDIRIKKGTMLSEIPFLNFPVIAKNTGLDFFIIDNEHGAFDYSAVSAISMNAKLTGIKMIVRLPDNSRMNITKFADAGAGGFLLPMTNCAADIEQVVKYAKYSPIGQRGISTTRIHTLYNPPSFDVYSKQANEQMKIYAQIETLSGVEKIDEILQVNGVEGIFIGPNDLSADLERLNSEKSVYDCIATVLNAVKKHGKQGGIITNNAKLIEYAKKCGVEMLSYGSELNMLIDGCKKIIEI